MGDRGYSTKIMRVLFAAAEADPIIKVGGLGDVAGSLPQSLRALSTEEAHGYQLDVRLVLPFHPVISSRIENIQPLVSFDVPHPDGPVTAQVYQTFLGKVPVYLIAGAPIQQNALVYSLNTREDGEKYTFFSLAVLELARALNWSPDILHANDWHTAIAVYMLAQIRGSDPYFTHTRSILTIHNLGFMGGGTDSALEFYGIPPLDEPLLPPWGQIQPLPMGLAAADVISTVSPTYAREILTPEFGYGLQDLLQARSEHLLGILNGLDENAWDPGTDPALPVPVTLETLEERAGNKAALLQEFGLAQDADLPLLVMISRMDYQKGVDLVIPALRQIAGDAWQAILLGTGDPVLESAAHQLEAEFPDRVRAAVRFDARLSRRMYGGGDLLIMPSRYEPCGLAQMIAMRYGCIPAARATGGLRDTIQDNPAPRESTGFLFDEASPEALANTLRRAIAAYQNREDWLARQRFGMQQDFSWQRSAQTYALTYHRLVSSENTKPA